MDVENESDTAQLLGSNVAWRDRRGRRRNHEYVNNGQAMAVLSEPETLPNDDEAQEVQLKRLKGLSGSLDDSLPSVRAQRAAANMYAESRELHKRSTKESTPLLAHNGHIMDEKGGGSNDSSSDSLGFKGSYDSITTSSSAIGTGGRFKTSLKKWSVFLL